MLRWSILSACLILGGITGVVAAPLVSSPKPTPLTAPKELLSYRDIVKKVLPAVVSIETQPMPVAKTSQPVPKEKSSSNESQLPKEFRKFFEQFGIQPFGSSDQSHKFFEPFEGQPFEFPEPTPHHGYGSGFVVDPKGVILTNNHVVQGAKEVVVRLEDGRHFVTKEIKTDPKTDLAIVRIDAKSPLPYLELGNSDAMQIGDRVLAVGAPFGLSGSVTAGIISAKGRHLNMNLYENFLQTDAAINPGNSGGPLVNMEGQVIGVNTAIKSSTGGSQGVGLAIPSNLAGNIMEQLVKNGVVRRGYLGVQIRALEPGVAVRLGVKSKIGVAVAKVFDGTPAAKAGIKDGDVITAIGGKAIKNGTQMQQIVAALPLKKPVEVSIVRDGQARTFSVTIEQQPQNFGSRSTPNPKTPQHQQNALSLDKIGIELQDMTPELAEQFGFQDKTTGALVTQVQQGSIADEAGLQRGMLIVKVEHQAVGSAQTAQETLKKASLEKGILVQVRSPQGGVNYLLLKASAAK